MAAGKGQWQQMEKKIMERKIMETFHKKILSLGWFSVVSDLYLASISPKTVEISLYYPVDFDV